MNAIALLIILSGTPSPQTYVVPEAATTINHPYLWDYRPAAPPPLPRLRPTAGPVPTTIPLPTPRPQVRDVSPPWVPSSKYNGWQGAV